MVEVKARSETSVWKDSVNHHNCVCLGRQNKLIIWGREISKWIMTYHVLQKMEEKEEKVTKWRRKKRKRIKGREKDKRETQDSRETTFTSFMMMMRSFLSTDAPWNEVAQETPVHASLYLFCRPILAALLSVFKDGLCWTLSFNRHYSC